MPTKIIERNNYILQTPTFSHMKRSLKYVVTFKINQALKSATTGTKVSRIGNLAY